MSARQRGRSPSQTSGSMNYDFALLSPVYQSSLPQQNSSSDQPYSLHDSATSLASSSRQQLSRRLLLVSEDLPRTNPQDIQQQAADLLQPDLTYDLVPYANLGHESKVSSLEPWNHIDAVTTPMTSHPVQNLSDLQQIQKVPPLDSGYASSQKSRQGLQTNVTPTTSLEAGQGYTYNEPLDSAAQQHHFLPGLRQRPLVPPVASHTPTSPSTIADSTTPSSSPSVRCEECAEVFNTKSEKSKHMARHNKKYTCDFPNCPRATEGFATKNDLDRHKGCVHRDSNVHQKSYKCCVPGCKDPNKLWDRKDNFKAHVKRMHPNVDPDDVVKRSFQGESLPASHGPRSHTSSRSEHVPMNHMSVNPMTRSRYPGSEMAYPNPFTYHTDQDAWPSEGDLYDGTTMPELDQTRYQNPGFPPNSTISPSVTIGASLGISSGAVAATSNRAEHLISLYQSSPNTMGHTPMHAFGPQRVGYFPSAAYGPIFGNTNQTRPDQAQTAPIIGRGGDDEYQTNFPDSGQMFGPSPIGESSILAIDPALGTVGSGGWAAPSSNTYPQRADISDPALQTNINLVAIDQQSTSPVEDEHKNEVWQKLESILKQLPPEQMEFMVDAYEKHPVTPNKASCAVQKTLDAIKAQHTGDEKKFVCSREGCSKAFTHKNIRTKHEKRHDRLFFCTFDGCYSRFGSKDDLRRHEQKKHEREAYEGWRCFQEDVPTSQYRPPCAKFFFDGEKFQQHRRDHHHERAVAAIGGLKAMKSCHVYQGKPGHFWCGFCNKVISNDSFGTDGTKCDKNRYNHLDQHVNKERKTMAQWIDLKSEGLTKNEVEHHRTSPDNEDTDDEDEADFPSPTKSTTIGNTTSQIAGPTSQYLSVPLNNGSGRKRALSEAGLHPALPAAKRPRTPNHQIPPHSPSEARDVSNLVSTGQNPFNASHQRFGQVILIKCCQCDRFRFRFNTIHCDNPACRHRNCANCTLHDPNGNRLVMQPRPGNSQSHGN